MVLVRRGGGGNFTLLYTALILCIVHTYTQPCLRIVYRMSACLCSVNTNAAKASGYCEKFLIIKHNPHSICCRHISVYLTFCIDSPFSGTVHTAQSSISVHCTYTALCLRTVQIQSCLRVEYKHTRTVHSPVAACGPRTHYGMCSVDSTLHVFTMACVLYTVRYNVLTMACVL